MLNIELNSLFTVLLLYKHTTYLKRNQKKVQ